MRRPCSSSSRILLAVFLFLFFSRSFLMERKNKTNSIVTWFSGFSSSSSSCCFYNLQQQHNWVTGQTNANEDLETEKTKQKRLVENRTAVNKWRPHSKNVSKKTHDTFPFFFCFLLFYFFTFYRWIAHRALRLIRHLPSKLVKYFFFYSSESHFVLLKIKLN